jgi:hypothetical protein
VIVLFVKQTARYLLLVLELREVVYGTRVSDEHHFCAISRIMGIQPLLSCAYAVASPSGQPAAAIGAPDFIKQSQALPFSFIDLTNWFR